MQHRRSPLQQQRGSAILMAMLTVTIVATFASSALWQQWRTIEIETAERARLQAHWILGGALDWARMILREDARQSSADYLSEPWAVPLEEARLSTFLAASGSGDADTSGDGIPEVFLSGHMEDMQARLNISNLVVGGMADPASVATFSRLYHLLGIGQAELDYLVAQLRAAQTAATGDASPGSTTTNANASGTSTGKAPVLPQSIDQLTWLGISPDTLTRLRPYVTLLPVPTPVNLNTASAIVLYAAVSDFDWASAQRFVKLRDQKHLATIADAEVRKAFPGVRFNDSQHAVSTRFFEVHSQLRDDRATTQEVSVLQRDGLDVKVIARQFVAPDHVPG